MLLSCHNSLFLASYSYAWQDKHDIKYDDGEKETVVMAKEKWRWIKSLPARLPATTCPAAATAHQPNEPKQQLVAGQLPQPLTCPALPAATIPDRAAAHQSTAKPVVQQSKMLSGTQLPTHSAAAAELVVLHSQMQSDRQLPLDTAAAAESVVLPQQAADDADTGMPLSNADPPAPSLAAGTVAASAEIAVTGGIAQSSSLVLSDSAKTSQSQQSRESATAPAASQAEQQPNIAAVCELGDGSQAAAGASIKQPGNPEGRCAHSGPASQPAKAASASVRHGVDTAQADQPNLAKRQAASLHAVRLPTGSLHNAEQCSSAQCHAGSGLSKPAKADGPSLHADQAGCSRVTPAEQADAAPAAAASQQPVSFSSTAPVTKKRGRPPNKGRQQAVAQRKNKRKAALEPGTGDQQPSSGQQAAEGQQTKADASCEPHPKVSGQHGGGHQQAVFQHKSKRKAESVLKPAVKRPGEHGGLEQKPRRHSKWLPSLDQAEDLSEQHNPDHQQQQSPALSLVQTVAVTEEPQHGQHAQHGQRAQQAQQGQHDQRAPSSPQQNSKQPQQLRVTGLALQPCQVHNQLAQPSVTLPRPNNTHPSSLATPDSASTKCPDAQPTGPPVDVTKHLSPDRPAADVATDRPAAEPSVVAPTSAANVTVQSSTHGPVADARVQLPTDTLQPQAGRSLLLVASGLEKGQMDQLRRLCRRLHVKHGSNVDEHTTHVIVNVSLCLGANTPAHVLFLCCYSHCST